MVKDKDNIIIMCGYLLEVVVADRQSIHLVTETRLCLATARDTQHRHTKYENLSKPTCRSSLAAAI